MLALEEQTLLTQQQEQTAGRRTRTPKQETLLQAWLTSNLNGDSA